ncbi:type VI secretion system protein ImpK [Tahibacter aquaticus]|uniref:Type VI secretion system protein ImpK n=1 Tax=Tahibacter aquaticus TaxID=520092 RepID=A0A4R6Z7Q6_9GAMM|nr:DotU family type VI secretion system protein [Tahibacter aquaticus]TDR47860.1 type VI secretion system protein ImpK [Tahibacter aquaticus]
MTNPSFNAGNNRTFVMPSPGGAATPLSGSAQPVWQSHEPEIPSGNSPLIAVANPILNLVYQIRTLVHNADPDRLKTYLADEIRRFDANAKAQGIPAEHIVAARYCLCTVLDEAAAQTPWGGSGAWSKNSLLVTFHNETWGGEKFYQLLAKLAQTPSQHLDVLELMYYCIALGFEGRYRIVSNGQSQLETLKRRLADIIKTGRGVPDRALSIHWAGVQAEMQRIWGMIPVWVTGILAVVLGVGIFMLLAFWLAARSDKSFIAISSLKLPTPAPVVRAEPPPLRFSKFLEPEIKQGLVSVQENYEKSTVTIRGDGLFESGSATMRPQFRDIVDRIAAAINEVPGRVLVSGHTDDRPIRSVRFPSNWELSQERARAVAGQLNQSVRTPERISTEGRGEADPLADNATPAGRAQNRRVEITVFATPAELNKEVR